MGKLIGLIEAPAICSEYKNLVLARSFYSRDPVFSKRLEYSLALYDCTFVLSACNGMINLNQAIEPEDSNIASFTNSEFNDWKSGVVRTIEEIFPNNTEFFFLTGRKCWSLMSDLKNHYPCHNPTDDFIFWEHLLPYSGKED